MEESRRRRPMGPGSQGTMGRRSAVGRAKAARSGGPSAARPGQAAAASAGRTFQRHGHRAGAGWRAGDLGIVRILPRAVGRTRRRAALRQACAHRAARPELSSALSDRDRAAAEGAARLHDLDRHVADRRSGAARPHHAGRAGRKPDADRRRKHRRRRLHRVVADQARRRRQLPLQHPESRRHREGGGRKRDARGDRPFQHPADPHRRPHHDGSRACRN